MDTVTVHKSPVKVAALQKQVEQFRWLLQSPNLDPRPAGKQLYELFLAPFETQLGQVKHLLLTLDQSLGVFPFAALYDGTRYALERWNTSLLTPASQATLTRPTATEKTIALGVSEGAVAFPGVAQEVQALGQPALLNGDFTQERWLEVLQQEKRDICHIAGPFNLVGSESTWGLLLAEGKQLSLEQLRLLPAEVFTGLSLVTFSTFQTPAQDTEYTRGAIENIAHLVQRKGASAVVANIWSVSDSITSALMVDFYRRWKRNTSKSLALRDAQLAVLRGDIKPTAQLRTATSTRFPTVQAPPYPPIERRLHPFYWSGIVLFGNPR
jgi:CHAT domain-containing protein